MKLDYDCVRDLLLTLEEKLQFIEREDGLENPELSFNDLLFSDRLKKYSKSVILYTTQKLEEADYIRLINSAGDDLADDLSYQEITFSGHQYLDSIRNTSIWDEVKGKFKEKSLSMTFELVRNLALSLASAHLGIKL